MTTVKGCPVANEITHYAPQAATVAVGTLGFVDTQTAAPVQVSVREHKGGIVLLIIGDGLRRALHVGWPEARRLTDEMLAAVAGAPLDAATVPMQGLPPTGSGESDER